MKEQKESGKMNKNMEKIVLQKVCLQKIPKGRTHTMSSLQRKSGNLTSIATKRFTDFILKNGLPVKITCFYGKAMTNEIVCKDQADVDYAKEGFIAEYL